jgi:folate-binding protein YgfZ
VWREGDALELEIAANQQEKLLAHLNRYIIMDDVELVPLEDETAAGVTGAQADAVMTRTGLPALEALKQTRALWGGGEVRVRRSYGALAAHYEIWTAADRLSRLREALKEAGAIEVGSGSLEALRIAEGIPAYGVDMLERDLPQETSQLRALHFSKGCYLGQEIVERIRSRATVHRHLRQLELTGPLPASGTELFAAGESQGAKASGTITSVATLLLPSGARVFALGMVRAEAEASSRALIYTSGTARGEARILSAPPKFESE